MDRSWTTGGGTKVRCRTYPDYTPTVYINRIAAHLVWVEYIVIVDLDDIGVPPPLSHQSSPPEVKQ